MFLQGVSDRFKITLISFLIVENKTQRLLRILAVHAHEGFGEGHTNINDIIAIFSDIARFPGLTTADYWHKTAWMYSSLRDQYTCRTLDDTIALLSERKVPSYKVSFWLTEYYLLSDRHTLAIRSGYPELSSLVDSYNKYHI